MAGRSKSEPISAARAARRGSGEACAGRGLRVTPDESRCRTLKVGISRLSFGRGCSLNLHMSSSLHLHFSIRQPRSKCMSGATCMETEYRGRDAPHLIGNTQAHKLAASLIKCSTTCKAAELGARRRAATSEQPGRSPIATSAKQSACYAQAHQPNQGSRCHI